MSSQANTPPLLTICVITYNRSFLWPKIWSNLVSVLDYIPDVLISIADNNSEDGTYDLLSSLRASSMHKDRITLVKRSQNIGSVRNLFQSFKSVCTQYVCWSGDDDLINPTAVSLLIQALRSYQPDFIFEDPLSTPFVSTINPRVIKVKKYPRQAILKYLRRASCGIRLISRTSLINDVIDDLPDLTHNMFAQAYVYCLATLNSKGNVYLTNFNTWEAFDKVYKQTLSPNYAAMTTASLIEVVFLVKRNTGKSILLNVLVENKFFLYSFLLISVSSSRALAEFDTGIPNVANQLKNSHPALLLTFNLLFRLARLPIVLIVIRLMLGHARYMNYLGTIRNSLICSTMNENQRQITVYDSPFLY